MTGPLASVVATLRSAGCVFAEEEAALLAAAAGSSDELDAMVAARASGLPLEHVIGWAEFCGLRILVDPGVFVPRRRSKLLVEIAVELARVPADFGAPRPAAAPGAPAGRESGARRERAATQAAVSGTPPRACRVIVDLCCGTGALGIAVATALAEAGTSGVTAGPWDAATTAAVPRGPVELHAADLDPVAVACARRNVEPAGGNVYLGDLFEPLPASIRGRVGILICNAPYVPTTEIALMPPEARDHEARMALDGGPDGLAVLRGAAAEAPRWLAPGGAMLVETSERQAPAMAGVMTAAGLLPRVHADDETGATVITGTMPAAIPSTRR